MTKNEMQKIIESERAKAREEGYKKGYADASITLITNEEIV